MTTKPNATAARIYTWYRNIVAIIMDELTMHIMISNFIGDKYYNLVVFF
jgi:hypothetical protein